jgi:hypothetical protein
MQLRVKISLNLDDIAAALARGLLLHTRNHLDLHAGRVAPRGGLAFSNMVVAPGQRLLAGLLVVACAHGAYSPANPWNYWKDAPGTEAYEASSPLWCVDAER